MKRRDLLCTIGAATALALLPRDAIAAWARVASGVAPIGGLSDAHLALIGAVADTLLPRTDSPGAVDVGVPAFVNVLVSESYPPDDRKAFVAGLPVVEAQLRGRGGRPFVALSADERGDRIADIEDRGLVRRALSRLLRDGEPGRTYWKLKQLIIHGYFTSKPVGERVYQLDVVTGGFEGSVPFSPATGAAGGEGHAHA